MNKMHLEFKFYEYFFQNNLSFLKSLEISLREDDIGILIKPFLEISSLKGEIKNILVYFPYTNLI